MTVIALFFCTLALLTAAKAMPSRCFPSTSNPVIPIDLNEALILARCHAACVQKVSLLSFIVYDKIIMLRILNSCVSSYACCKLSYKYLHTWLVVCTSTRNKICLLNTSGTSSFRTSIIQLFFPSLLYTHDCMIL